MRIPFVLLTAALLSLAACRDAKVETYRVPSEKPEPLPPVLTGAVEPAPAAPAATADATTAGATVPTATGPALSWTAPVHWTAKPPSPMRKGSYAVRGEGDDEADFSVTAFPGDVGGELANFNRWRGQIGLPPLAESELRPRVERVQLNELHAAVVEFANPESQPPQRMIGAIVPLGGATWFFKLAGPDALVAREKTAFFKLLHTVKTSAPATR